jgi:CxxC motif-containing protein (DUF1111 family)
MRRARHSLHTSLHIIFGTLIVTLGASLMYGQTTTNGAVDPGPRNPGTVGFNMVCPNGNPVKFPPPSASTPNCVDIDQPPSTQFPANGAGNNVASTATGNPLAAFWGVSINVFEAVASVQGTVSGEPVLGLGPAFNSNSCFSCHQSPTVGGTTAGIENITLADGTTTKQFAMPLAFGSPALPENPELTAASDQSGANSNPLFPSNFSSSGSDFIDVPTNGPSLEVRIINGGGSGGFVVQPGAVAELFTIQGRTDATGCTLAQFPFSSLGSNSVSFRIPTPTFGLGLVEATTDAQLMQNSPASTAAAAAANLGVVTGFFNRSGNDGTITRFGWKAQNKSLLIFAGEASNVEMGVTNELFPNEKTFASGSGCFTNSLSDVQPEDEILPQALPSTDPPQSVASIISANTQNNAVFMRMNSAPSQCDEIEANIEDPYGTTGPSVCPPFTKTPVLDGQAIFAATKGTNFIGCNLCHTINLTSGPSQNAALSNQQFEPYSDFALHNMGPTTNGLADGVTQGLATSEYFRTAPLWGIGQRIFFLHDGRAQDLATAIADHCPITATTSPTSNESCQSIALFNALPKAAQQDVLDFLRSL